MDKVSKLVFEGEPLRVAILEAAILRIINDTATVSQLKYIDMKKDFITVTPDSGGAAQR